MRMLLIRSILFQNHYFVFTGGGGGGGTRQKMFLKSYDEEIIKTNFIIEE